VTSGENVEATMEVNTTPEQADSTAYDAVLGCLYATLVGGVSLGDEECVDLILDLIVLYMARCLDGNIDARKNGLDYMIGELQSLRSELD
jgi:hypothetical protein